MPLTKEQIEKYVKEGGVRCPFCKSGDLEVGELQGVSNPEGATRDIMCTFCKEEWQEVFVLTRIEEL